MDFYILKKQEKLVAIPADEQNCKQYLEDGYFYVDKVAACNESLAGRLLWKIADPISNFISKYVIKLPVSSSSK